MKQELASLQWFRLNFAGEPDVVIPEPYPEQSGEKVLTMAADPHPGNFLLPDSQHLAILDFGDVGRRP